MQAGSKTPMPVRRNGGELVMLPTKNGKFRPLINMVDDATLSDEGKARKAAWVRACRRHAEMAYRGMPVQGKPLRLSVMFAMPRPGSHYGTGRNASTLKPDAPRHHLQAPDATKLLRCLEDSLRGFLFDDDCIIVEQIVRKEWAEKGKHGAWVRVEEVAEAGLFQVVRTSSDTFTIPHSAPTPSGERAEARQDRQA